MFTSLLNKTATFKTREITRNKYGRETSSINTSSYVSSGEFTVPCYLTIISNTSIDLGKRVRSYTNRLFLDYDMDIVSKLNDYIIEIDGKSYEIDNFIETFNNHHIECDISIIENK